MTDNPKTSKSSQSIDLAAARKDLSNLNLDKSGLQGLLDKILSKLKEMSGALAANEQDYRTSADKTTEKATKIKNQAQQTWTKA